MLTWDDFINFKDDDPLKDAGTSIDLFVSKYQGMVNVVQQSNDRLADDMKQVTEAAAGMLEGVKKLNLGLDANEDALAGTSKASEELVKDFEALKKVEAENSALIKQMTDEIEKLKKAREKLPQSYKAEADSMDDLKVKLAEAEKAYKAMGTATDQAVKDEQLAKVRGLAAEYKALNGPLNDAKKGAIVAAGSYNELAARVTEAKKRLKEMEGGLAGNSKEFKELQKFAKEGTEQLKGFDETVGDNTRNVGGYQGAIIGAVEKLKMIPGAAGAADSALKVLSSTPVIAILTALAGAVALLTSYFKGSIEGQDDLNKVMQVGNAIFQTLKDVAEALGKALFKAISEPKKLWLEFVNLVKGTWEEIVHAFENPTETLKAFGQAILDNVILRVQGLGKIFQAVGKIIKSGFTDGFEDITNAAIQAATGVENAVDKIVDVFKPLTDEMQRRFALGQQIADAENKLRKDRIADILDDAKTELEVVKLLVGARDKLRFTEEERFEKLRAANKLLEDQLEGDLQLARDEINLQRLIIQQDGETYDARQKLVELQAKEIELQKTFFQARKKRQAEEIALIREIEKEAIDARKRTVDAERALNTVRMNDIIKANQAILADENSTLEARLQAITENDAAAMALLEQDRDAQLEVSKEAALDRIQLDSDTLDQIYSNNAISINERIAQERAAKELLLGEDEAFVDQTLKIQEDFTNKSNDLLESSKKLAEDNVFKILARDADIATSTITAATNDQLRAINEAFSAGDISSIQEFEAQKLAVQRAGQEESIQLTIDYLKKRASLLEEGSKERVQVEEKISALELQLSKAAADERLRTEQALQNALTNLRQVAFDSAVTIMNNLFEAGDQDRERQMTALEDAKNKELELAGDNAEAKAAIEKEYTEKQKVIEKQQAEANRKRAIFEKALAITEIGINTAKGIGQALGAYIPPASFIIAAAVGAAGALQIAAVASKPIPAFAEGTEDAPGGWAIINEQGPEAVTYKGKTHVINSDGPTLAYIPQHAKVHTAEETERLKEFDNYAHHVGLMRSGVDTVVEVNGNNQELLDTINRRMLSLEATIRSKPVVQMNWTKQGAELILQNAQANTKFLNEFFS